MKIAVVGTGYVGLVSGTCFAETGVTVTCVDIDKIKIENLKKGIIPIYEPGLENMVRDNVEKGRLFFSTSLKESLVDCDAVFIAVGTPPGEDGSADLKYVLAVADEDLIGLELTNNHTSFLVSKNFYAGTLMPIDEALSLLRNFPNVNLLGSVVIKAAEEGLISEDAILWVHDTENERKIPHTMIIHV